MKSEWRQAVVLVLALKLASLLFLFAASRLAPRADWGGADVWFTRPTASFIDRLCAFDGAWFVRIGALGYRRLADGDYDLATAEKNIRVIDRLGYDQARWPREPGSDRFDRGYGYRHWPLYPWLIRLGYAVGLDAVWAAVLIANLCAVAYGLLFYRLARLDLDQRGALIAVALSQLHPGAFALSAAYSEPLFLALAAGSFLAARRDRWWLAGALGGLAALTRIFGVVLAAPLAYLWLRKRHGEGGGFFAPLAPGSIMEGIRSWPGLWFIGLVAAGGLGVLLAFHFAAGDAMVWTRVHEGNVHGSVNWPWLMMIETYKKGPHVWLKELPLHFLLLGVVMISWRRVPGEYWLWMALFFLFHVSNGNHSYLRYQAECLPLFFAGGAMLAGRPWTAAAVTVVSAALFGVFAVMYMGGYWVA